MKKGVSKWPEFYADMRALEHKKVDCKNVKKRDWISKREEEQRRRLEDDITHEKLCTQEFQRLQDAWKAKDPKEINLYEMNEFP